MLHLEGKTIGRLLVVERTGKKDKRKNCTWKCRCICGVEKEVSTSDLTRTKGGVRSCGCLVDGSYNKTHGMSKTPEFYMYFGAKKRAKKHGREFNIEISDIVVPEFCPILGMKLVSGGYRTTLPSAPTLDRIDSSLGYIKGNVWVVSHRANSLKSNASVEELEAVIAFLKSQRKQAAYV